MLKPRRIEHSWSWGESNPRPSGGHASCYDHSRVCGSRLPRPRVGAPLSLSSVVRGLSLRSVVSPTVHHYFCCQAVVVRPRVALRLAMCPQSLPENQAARANCCFSAVVLLPRLTSLSNSGRTMSLPVPTSKPISPLSMNNSHWESRHARGVPDRSWYRRVVAPTPRFPNPGRNRLTMFPFRTIGRSWWISIATSPVPGTTAR